jgi:hypothetical protein
MRNALGQSKINIPEGKPTEQVALAHQGKHHVTYDDRDDEEEKLLDNVGAWQFIDAPVPPLMKDRIQARILHTVTGIKSKQDICRPSLHLVRPNDAS